MCENMANWFYWLQVFGHSPSEKSFFVEKSPEVQCKINLFDLVLRCQHFQKLRKEISSSNLPVIHIFHNESPRLLYIFFRKPRNWYARLSIWKIWLPDHCNCRGLKKTLIGFGSQARKFENNWVVCKKDYDTRRADAVNIRLHPSDTNTINHKILILKIIGCIIIQWPII